MNYEAKEGLNIILTILFVLNQSTKKFTINSLAKEIDMDPNILRKSLISFIYYQVEDDYVLHINDLVFRSKICSTDTEIKVMQSYFDLETDTSIINDYPICLYSTKGHVVVTKEQYNLLTKLSENDNQRNNYDEIKYIVSDDYFQYSLQKKPNSELLPKILEKLSSSDGYYGCLRINPSEELLIFGFYYYVVESALYAIACKNTEKESDIQMVPLSYLKEFPIRIKTTSKNIEKYRNIVNKVRNYIWSPHNIPLNAKIETHKILVLDNQPNVLKKIRYDLQRFNPIEKYVPNIGSYFIYDIIATPEYLPWILSFGSSIVVISPKSIAQDVLNEYTAILLQYQKPTQKNK